MSKFMMAALGCLMLVAVPLVMGQSVPAKKAGTDAQKKQQERSNACTARANDQGLTGSARSSFISSCLTGDKSVGASQKGQGK